MTDRIPYSIPKEPGRWRAIALAAAVHAALIVFLWIGVHWQSQVPVAVEAEVWSPEVREAAPPPPTPTPTPPPEPIEKPVPQPVQKPVVTEAPPPPKVVQPVVPDPEIALEKERKRKVQEKKDRDHAEQVLEDKERQRKADEQEKAQEKKDAAKLADKLAAKQKAADDKKKADADAKKAAEADDKLKQKQEAAKEAAKKAAIDKQRKADDAASDKRHNDDMKRLLGQATGNGASNSTGTAAQSQGPRGDPGYAQKVGAKIKGFINFNVPDGMAGNPSVEYEVQLLPDGSVASIHLRKPSGVSGFDEAVKRAIERSAPYPKDKSGSVPSSFIGIHKPKDQ
ncbi:cell envelope integrity protein TolA [Glaciimonas sp. GNP009]